jgi:GTPase SAR1 family protein
MNTADRRHVLVVASQCKNMEALTRLREAASNLRDAFLDQDVGVCEPALPSGESLLYGELPVAEIEAKVRAAIGHAAEQSAVLVLALLGHGFNTGTAPALYLMGWETEQGMRHSAIDVGRLLFDAVDTPGVGGVIGIIDTSNAAAAPLRALGLATGGNRQARLSLLMASEVGEAAYDHSLSQNLAKLLRSGVADDGPRLHLTEVAAKLRAVIHGQSVATFEYGGGHFSEPAWLALNPKWSARGGWDFFVSYTQTDRTWAEWISWVLEEDGYRVLVQAWDFLPGSNWVQGMQTGTRDADRTIAVLSPDYLKSVYGGAEWQAAWASDPQGTGRKLLAVRVAECDLPGMLSAVVTLNLYGLDEATARAQLRNLVSAAIIGRAKPATAPAFPGPSRGYPSTAPAFPAPGAATARVWEVAEVFQPTGVPEVTFVQPEWFAKFLMALRQPGLSIVLEGPSGVGKTTLLQHAIEQDSQRLRQSRMFTARDPVDIAAIADLVRGGDHQGIAAIDDFHRLPTDLQAKVADYLKLLADRGDRRRKLIIVGIPQTAHSLVRISFDLANRIREFRLGWATDRQVLSLLEQGENALNIEFDDKPALVAAAGGSLITAQSLCWHLMGLARIEETLPDLITVSTDIDQARDNVFRELRLKYHEAVAEFTSLDDRAESACIDLLMALAAEPDGVLYLDAYNDRQPSQAASADKVLASPTLAASEAISRVLYYDPKGRRLIADDPQFVFYIRHLDRQELMREAGKRLPPLRHRVFLCYSRANAAWMKRLLVHLGPLHKDNLVDVWSDERIQPGDDWRAEIDAALAMARFAVLPPGDHRADPIQPGQAGA